MAAIPGYYSPAEAARIIGVSQSQITRYVKSGLLKAVDLGHQLLLEQGEVHQFRRPPRGNPEWQKPTN